MEWIGWVVVGVVTAQLLVMLYGEIRRIRGEVEQRHLSFALLRQRIAAADALRVRREQAQLFWNGVRKFVVRSKVEEAANIFSFYLEPHDGKALPQFQPGQYLTFRINVPGHSEPLIRCYSLSDRPHPDYYRITIKRVPPPPDVPEAPPGVVSNYFIDHVREGDILDVQAPRGNFVLDTTRTSPIVLIAGGIGITPLLSMLASIVDQQIEREVWLFHGVRNRREHALRDQIDKLNQRHERTRVIVCHSAPLPEDKQGRDYVFAEHISVPMLQNVLQSSNYDYYVCGPPPMMANIIPALKKWGVPKDHIFTEAFGPASGKVIAAVQREESKSEQDAKPPAAKRPQVTFQRSNTVATWDDSFDNLLDLALKNNVRIESGCRAGSCGTCLVAIKSGRVVCTSESHADIEEGTCLTCVSVPDDNLVLDL